MLISQEHVQRHLLLYKHAQKKKKNLQFGNQMKVNVENIKNLQVIKKNCQSLTVLFEHMMTVIENSKNLNDIKIDELQGPLVAHKYCLNSKKSIVTVEKTL